MTEPFEIVKVRTRVKKWDTKPGWYASIPLDWLRESRKDTTRPLQISRDYKQQFTGLIQIKYGCIEVTEEMQTWIHAVYPLNTQLGDAYIIVEMIDE